MALTFTAQPGTVNFSKNPILVKVRTSLSGKTFLRIICNCQFILTPSLLWNTFNVAFSSPVSDGGEVTFNLSEASQTLINNVYRESNAGDAINNVITERVQITCQESWIENGEEKTGGAISLPSQLYILPGGMTDFERMKASSLDVETLIGSVRMLTRKPDGGIVYNGETLILPLTATSSGQGSKTFTLTKNESKIAESNFYITAYSLSYANMAISTSSDGPFRFSGAGNSLSGYMRANNEGVHFLRFINGFGALENISVKSLDILSYDMDSEESSLVTSPTLRPSPKRMNRKSTPVGSYELSSGFVNERWAEWFMQELLPTPMAWMQIGGVWVPGTIEADDSTTIYNKTKIEMLHVDFTFRMAIDGGLKNLFV